MQGYTGLYSIDERQTCGVCTVIPPSIPSNVSSFLLKDKGFPALLLKFTHSAEPGL